MNGIGLTIRRISAGESRVLATLRSVGRSVSVLDMAIADETAVYIDVLGVKGTVRPELCRSSNDC
jgi:hypothetical protein